jgi:hypothetical protein
MSHAGVVIKGGDRDSKAFHMMNYGMIYEPLIEFLKRIDSFGLVEVKLTKDQYREAMRRVDCMIEEKEKYEYDFAQELGNGHYLQYCSEIILRLIGEYIEDEKGVRFVLGRNVFDARSVLSIGDLIYTNSKKLRG